MAEQVFLNELNTDSKSYKVRVKVIDKGRAKPLTSPGVRYQTLLLEDDKGNKMKAALFGEQIEGFEDVLEYNGIYDIANAPITVYENPLNPKSDEPIYQMSFGQQTAIQPALGQPNKIRPKYQAIGTIPKVGHINARFDVVGVILYVEPAARIIVTPQGRKSLVRELVIMDHSVQQPLIISLWNDLSGVGCDNLEQASPKFLIVGFTAMRISSHKGFSLTSSMSTIVIHDPTGNEAKELTHWVALHEKDLASCQGRVINVRNPPSVNGTITLRALRHKKAHNTLQDERHWIKATIPNVNLEKIHAYIGCSRCGKRSHVPLQTKFACPNCSERNSVASPRLTFNCELRDGTDRLGVTAFTQDAAKLLRVSVEEIFKIKEENDEEAFKVIAEKLESTQTLIELAPKMSLSRTNVLQWILKKVEPTIDEPKPANEVFEKSAKRKLFDDGAGEDNTTTQAQKTKKSAALSEVISTSTTSIQENDSVKQIVRPSEVTTVADGIFNPTNELGLGIKTTIDQVEHNNNVNSNTTDVVPGMPVQGSKCSMLTPKTPIKSAANVSARQTHTLIVKLEKMKDNKSNQAASEGPTTT